METSTTLKRLGFWCFGIRTTNTQTRTGGGTKLPNPYGWWNFVKQSPSPDGRYETPKEASVVPDDGWLVSPVDWLDKSCNPPDRDMED